MFPLFLTSLVFVFADVGVFFFLQFYRFFFLFISVCKNILTVKIEFSDTKAVIIVILHLKIVG